MHLAARLRPARDLRVATVDHRTRLEAAREAEGVAAAARALGLPHDVLRPDHVPPARQGPLREVRLGLLGDWARRHGLAAVLTGHTRDDQAESVMMALARGGGVDLLSGIPPTSPDGVFRRPLLSLGRDALRAWLRGRAIPWVDDPSNEDPRHERVRARRALVAMGPGAGAALARVATLAAERRALEEGAVPPPAPDGIALDAFRALPSHLRARALRAALADAGAVRLRGRAVARLGEALAAGRVAGTLGGCEVRLRGGHLIVRPETGAARAAAAGTMRPR